LSNIIIYIYITKRVKRRCKKLVTKRKIYGGTTPITTPWRIEQFARYYHDKDKKPAVQNEDQLDAYIDTLINKYNGPIEPPKLLEEVTDIFLKWALADDATNRAAANWQEDAATYKKARNEFLSRVADKAGYHRDLRTLLDISSIPPIDPVFRPPSPPSSDPSSI